MKKILLLLFVLFQTAYLIAQDEPVHIKIDHQRISTQDPSNCEYKIILNATIDDGWHMYSLKPSPDGPNPTKITINKSKDFEIIGAPYESKAKRELDKVFGVEVGYFANQATFTQKIRANRSGVITITGKYEYQACTEEKCIFPPATDFTVVINGESRCVEYAKPSKTTSVVTSPSINTTPNATNVVTNTTLQSTETTSVTVHSENKSSTSQSWWLIFLLGFIGGFAAIVTPCVFPMIPMNVSFFTKQSKTKSQGIKNALIYAASIIVLYLALGLGVTLMFGAGALHTISTNVYFNLAFFVLLLVFGISFLGAFEITLPSGLINKMDAKSDRGGLIGIFFMAFTLTLVSFSCTGPIIGTLLVEASSSGNIAGPFFGMLGFSLALALPFGLFAAFPGWLNSLPKSGGWLNTVKVTLGFIEIALALKFASNADLVWQAGYLTREVFIALWIVIFGLLTLYLLGLFKTSHDSEVKYLSVGRLFVVMASLFVTIYLIPGLWGAPLKLFSGILPPQDYSESPNGFGSMQASNINVSVDVKQDEFSKHLHTSKSGIIHFKNDYENALAYAKKMNKPLLVDYTGHACANCRKTEDNVWINTEIMNILNNEVVLVSLYVDDKRPLDEKDYMKVFWYGKQRTITDIGDKFKYMEERLYNQSTQPLYVLLNHNEKAIAPIRGYNPSISEYTEWLKEGISNFKK